MTKIYFHVGLGKNASTYLQYRFFPKLKGVKYVQRTKYNRFDEILKENKHESYLFSREFDRQLEYETNRFSEKYPDTKTIIILRSHESWIASQYRRYVKNGGNKSFEEFIDIENDLGEWKQKDLLFFPKIQHLEKKFNHKPLVLFHDDLKKDSYAFFDKLAAFTESSYNKEQINLKAFHKSYNEKQLKYMRKWGKKVLSKKPDEYKNMFHKRISERSRLHLCHAMLFVAKLAPGKNIQNEVLTSKEYSEKIKKHFQEDWKLCIEYAKNNNPS